MGYVRTFRFCSGVGKLSCSIRGWWHYSDSWPCCHTPTFPLCDLAGVIGAAAMFCGSFLLMYLTFGSAQAEAGAVLRDHGLWKSTFPPVTDPSGLLSWFIDVHTGRMFAYPIGGSGGGSVLTFALFVVGTLMLWRKNTVAVLILFSPLPLMFITASLQMYPYGGSARVAQHFAPAICLLAGVGLSGLIGLRSTPGKMIRRRTMVCMFLTGIILIGMVRDIVKPYKEKSALIGKQVVQQLAACTPASGQWVVFGSTEDVTHAPNLMNWGGTAARFRFNILRYAKGPVSWAPPPGDLDQLDDGPTLLLVYIDNKEWFPEPQFDRYLAQMTRRFGTPVRQEFPHESRAEALVVYEFNRDNPAQCRSLTVQG